MRSGAGADPDVAVPGDRGIARRRAVLEAPHRNALKAVFSAPPADGPVVRLAHAQIWHAHRRQAQVFADRGVGKGEERVGRELVRAELRGPGQIGSHVSGSLVRQGEHDVRIDRGKAALREQCQGALGDDGLVVASEDGKVLGLE